MTNPDCDKCGEMMSKGFVNFATKYSCRHCEEAYKEKTYEAYIDSLEMGHFYIVNMLCQAFVDYEYAKANNGREYADKWLTNDSNVSQKIKGAIRFYSK